jgi:hypothetical protein
MSTEPTIEQRLTALEEAVKEIQERLGPPLGREVVGEDPTYRGHRDVRESDGIRSSLSLCRPSAGRTR